MIEGGVGGSSTQTGLRFEGEMDLQTALKTKGFGLRPLTIEGFKSSAQRKPQEVLFQGRVIGFCLPASSLYAYLQNFVFEDLKRQGLSKAKILDRLKADTATHLETRGLSKEQIAKVLDDSSGWKGPLSSRLLPDEAFLNLEDNTLYVIEKKMQTVAGSVDEKLQTFDFKRKHYELLVKPFGLNVKYTYVLSFWFNQPKYFDVLLYMKNNGQDYWIQESPDDFTVDMKILGLDNFEH